MTEKLVYDSKGAIFGRMATVIAKELLKGKSIDLINCEEIIISGRKGLFAERVLQKRKMGSGGSLKGPRYIRQSDRLVKRMIRGMLPWDRTKGREAFKRLRCYVGTGDLDEEKIKSAIQFEHRKPSKYSTIKEIVRLLK